MTTRLETITEHAHQGRYGNNTADVLYLLDVIHLKDQITEAQQIASLDPDNQEPECYCVTYIRDDQGETISSEYNPLCPQHGTEKDPVL